MDTFIQLSFNDLNEDVKIVLKKYYDIKIIKNYNFHLNKKKLEIKELDEIIYFDKYLIEIQDNEIVKEEETEREIDPKYIKILNNYYNEDEIKYYFKKNIIIVEVDYYHNLLILKIY